MKDVRKFKKLAREMPFLMWIGLITFLRWNMSWMAILECKIFFMFHMENSKYINCFRIPTTPKDSNLLNFPFTRKVA